MNLADLYIGHCNFAYLQNVSNERVFIYGVFVEPGGYITVPVDLATTVIGMVDAFEIQGLTSARASAGPVFGWDASYAPTEDFEQPGDVTYQTMRREQSFQRRSVAQTILSQMRRS